ncbi:hypothetical protein ACP4OV_000839 [Aristida adscensionis]
MLQKWKAAGDCGAAPSTGSRRRPCVVLSLSMLALAAAILAFLAIVPDLGASRLFRDGVKAPPRPTTTTTTTMSHVVFGIAGSMRGHVWFDREPPGPWPEATRCPPYRVSGLWEVQSAWRRPYMSRLARILWDSFLAVAAEAVDGTAASGPEVRWFVKGDDDTVFFPDNLLAVLQKYDHREMYYIGAPSESVEQDVALSYGQAFGGGGIVVSYPAAVALTRAMDDGCLDRYSVLRHSDERVHACLSELGIPLTREPGFHQVDITGDAYGMLAAHPVAPLVSLHHLDRIQPIRPQGKTQLDAMTSLVGASRLDPARTLQQSFCYHRGRGYNLSVSVAWGYTVQVYPWAVPPVELEVPLQTFRTWRGRPNGTFLFNTRPLSPGDACARPAVFFLSRLRNETGAGGTVSEYTRHATPPEECDKPGFRAASAVRSVRVSAPKMSPSDWKRTTEALLQGGEDYAEIGSGGADTRVWESRARQAVEACV